MLLLAKAALTIGGTLALATAYTFHQGVIRIEVDEARAGGSHVHFWVPATVVPMALHLAPKKHLREAAAHAQEFLPTIRALTRGLEKYPNADLVEVMDKDQHVQIRTRDGKLRIDVVSPEETVHIACPLATLEDVSNSLESNAPGV